MNNIYIHIYIEVYTHIYKYHIIIEPSYWEKKNLKVKYSCLLLINNFSARWPQVFALTLPGRFGS